MNGTVGSGTSAREEVSAARGMRDEGSRYVAKSTLGQRLREARLALGLTQEALGRPDFTKGFISLLENDRARPSVASLERIAARLGRPVSYFLDGGDSVVSAKVLDVLRSRGRAELTRRRYDAALETFAEMRRVAAGRHDALLELHAALGEGEALSGLRRFDEARTRLNDARDGARRLEAPLVECRASHCLAGIELQEGRFGRAVSLYRTALDLARRFGDTEPALRGEIHLHLGAALFRMGRLDEAAEAYDDARRIFEDATQPDRVGEVLYGLGNVLFKDGDYDGAMRRFERAQELFEQYEDLRNLSSVRDQVGALLMKLGRPDEAVPHLEASLAVKQRVHDAAGECRTLTELARCLYARGESANAKELAGRAVALSREWDLRDEEARALAVLGSVAAAAGDVKEAHRALAAAAKHCEEAGMAVELVAIYRELAGVAGLAGRYKEATVYHERAFKLLQAVRPPDIVDALRSTEAAGPAVPGDKSRTSA